MNTPPKPACFISSIEIRISCSFSCPFHTHNGAGRYPAGGSVKYLVAPKTEGHDYTRKYLSELEAAAKIYGAHGLAWMKVEDGSLDALSLYPNPFVDEIRIDGPWETVSRISIMNLRGQLLAEFSGRSVLKVSTLPGGLYFIRVEGKDGGFRTYKMVKH